MTDNQWVFTGKKLQIWIPAIYEERDLLTLGDTATSLGIFQLRINDTLSCDMMILAKVNMDFVTDTRVIEDDYQYIVLDLKAGSVFIRNTDIVKNSNLAYGVFMTFIALGKIPPFINYNMINSLFDNDKKCCGISLNVNHAIFEMIYAQMYRDSSDAYMFYRHTDMRKAPRVVPIHQISHGPQSTSAKIIGSYMKEGIVASLVDDSEHSPSVVENLFRS